MKWASAFSAMKGGDTLFPNDWEDLLKISLVYFDTMTDTCHPQKTVLAFSPVILHNMPSSSSGTMGPAPIGVHCLSCDEFLSSVILGELFSFCSSVLHQLTMSSIHSLHVLPLLFVLSTVPNISVVVIYSGNSFPIVISLSCRAC